MIPIHGPLVRILASTGFILCATALALSPAGCSRTSRTRDRMSRLPATVLWAWERPENLDFIDPQRVAVAYLDQTLTLAGDRVAVRPRLNPLRVPPGTSLVAVARIEPAPSRPPDLSSKQRAAAVDALVRMARGPSLTAIQIDFDARLSERPFYGQLLRDLRRAVPPSMLVSITALASWCMEDDWIAGLPIDEAVPMLFRMGPAKRMVHIRLRSGRTFRPELCAASAGISTDEPLPALPRLARVYVFHPGPWSPSAYDEVTERLKR